MGVTCKCGARLCLSHRHPEDHACGFDHKRFQLDRLSEQNPAVLADKVPERI